MSTFMLTGMDFCLMSATPGILPSSAPLGRPHKFKMLMDPGCHGTFTYAAGNNKRFVVCDRCEQDKTFIVVT